MTPKEAAELVLENWRDDSVNVDTNLAAPIVLGKDGGQKFFPTWLAAAEYTLEHAEQIRQKQEEIIKVQRQVDDHHFFCQRNLYGAQRDGAIWERILAMLQSQLAARLVGWREQEEPKQ